MSLDSHLKALLVDVADGSHRVEEFPLGPFLGPVDLGLHLTERDGALNFGTGLLAGSILPGSNRLIFTGISPCWEGFFISSMGGAGLVFDDLGVNLVSLRGRASRPSVLFLHRSRGEDVEVRIEPVDVEEIWERGGFYALHESLLERFGGAFERDPRVLATGPASRRTDLGAVGSIPVKKGRATHADTWAGRGGLGSRMLQEHGIAGAIFGGTFLDEDFRNRTAADGWFREKYDKKLAAKDFEATTKYRFDPRFGTGGTFGVNFSTVGGRLLAFNYRSVHWSEAERLAVHEELVRDHYLRQFNEETIEPREQRTCGEPCAAVCKKLEGVYKKDYEPYQALGPLCGVFDQRAAESLVRKADALGFDAISGGGVVAWLMECLAEGDLEPEELAVRERPVFDHRDFAVVADSAHNAALGEALLDTVMHGRGVADFTRGARAFAEKLAGERGRAALDRFVCTAFGRGGWMVPNQYWTPGVLSPMPVMGKYYNDYGREFFPPRELGRRNAVRFVKELGLDNLGFCRFHRGWAEEMGPAIVDSLFGCGEEVLESARRTARRLFGGRTPVFWESRRNADFVGSFLRRRRDVEGDSDPALLSWIGNFEKDRGQAALSFWSEVGEGVREGLLPPEQDAF